MTYYGACLVRLLGQGPFDSGAFYVVPALFPSSAA